MKSVIVAAGSGSRLQGVSAVKPLARLAGQTLLDHTLESCARAGAESAVIVLGFSAQAIEDHLNQRGSKLPLPVATIVNEDWPVGNGSSLLAAAPALDGDDCVLTMCDHLFDPAIMQSLIKAERQAGCDLILAVDRNLSSDLVDVDDVTKVREAEGRIQAIGKDLRDYNCYDTGLFRLSSAVFATLAEIRKHQDMLGISDAVRRLAVDGRACVLDIGQSFWIDVDDANMFAIASRELARRKPADDQRRAALA